MILLSIIILFTVFIINFLFIVWQIKKYKIILPTSYAMLFLLFIYSIFPILFLSGLLDVSSVYKYSLESSSTVIFYFISSILILIYFVSFYFGYFILKRKYYTITSNEKDKINFWKLFWTLFLITTLFYLSYVYIYGGFSYIIENISHIRSGKDAHKNYYGAFFRMFSEYYIFLLFSFFAYINLAREKQKLSNSIITIKKIRILIALFLILLLFVLAKKFLDGGRGGLISVTIGLLLVYNLQYKKLNFKYILLNLVIAVVIVLYGKTVLFQLFLNNNIQIIESDLALFYRFVGNFAHGYMSLANSLEKDLGADRLFGDFIFWLFKPLKLFGMNDFDSVSYYNTYHILGEWDSNIPPAIVAFLFQQGGVVFVPIGAFVLGVLFSYLDKLVYNSSFSRNPYIIAFLSIIILQHSRIFGGADMALYIQSIFVYVALLLYFLMIKNITITRIDKIY